MGGKSRETIHWSVTCVVRGVTLPGALEGIRYLFIPNWQKLLDLAVWRDAASQVIRECHVTANSEENAHNNKCSPRTVENNQHFFSKNILRKCLFSCVFIDNRRLLYEQYLSSSFSNGFPGSHYTHACCLCPRQSLNSSIEALGSVCLYWGTQLQTEHLLSGVQKKWATMPCFSLILIYTMPCFSPILISFYSKILKTVNCTVWSGRCDLKFLKLKYKGRRFKDSFLNLISIFYQMAASPISGTILFNRISDCLLISKCIDIRPFSELSWLIGSCCYHLSPAMQVFFSLGISWGGIIMLGSYNKFNARQGNAGLYTI